MNIASAPTPGQATPSPSSGALASFTAADSTPNHGADVADTFLALLANVAGDLGPSADVQQEPTAKRNSKDIKKESVAALFGPGQIPTQTQTDVFAGLTLQFSIFSSTPAAPAAPVSGNVIANSGPGKGLQSPTALAQITPDPAIIPASTANSQRLAPGARQQPVTTSADLDFRQLLFGPSAGTNIQNVIGHTSQRNTMQGISATDSSAPLAFAVKLTENVTAKDPAASVRGGDAAVNEKSANVTAASPQEHDEAVPDTPQPTVQNIPPVVELPEPRPQPHTEPSPTKDESPALLGNHRDQTQTHGDNNDGSLVDRNAITQQSLQAQQQQPDKGEAQQREPSEKPVQLKQAQQIHSSEPESQPPSAAKAAPARDDARFNAPSTTNVVSPQTVRAEDANAPRRAQTFETPNQASPGEITEINRPVHLPTTREISMRIATPDSSNVDIKLVDRAGSVRVAVRTDDADLARNLQGGLSDLVQKLEKQGFEAEPWAPDRTVGVVAAQPSQASPSGSDQQHHGSRDPRDASQQGNSGHQQGGRNRPRWVAELEFAATETERS